MGGGGQRALAARVVNRTLARGHLEIAAGGEPAGEIDAPVRRHGGHIDGQIAAQANTEIFLGIYRFTRVELGFRLGDEQRACRDD